MRLHIEQREREGVVILDMTGQLTLGQGDLEVRERLAALHESGKVNIILNLQEVTKIDSTGLGTLVFGLARLRKSGWTAGAAERQSDASEIVSADQAGPCL